MNQVKKKKNDQIDQNVKKSFYINNIEEVLESNFEEIILEMKNNSYNSVIAIGESFYKDPTNYSERYPDITKFTEYVNNEFTRMIDNIINKKEIFIDEYEKNMKDTLYNISSVISKKNI
jgi:basic membrane lipoprotein Med (substrate-binding protein (PBP1-ABC) superfamily)